MAADWKWEDFDQEVEQEVAAISKRLGVTSLEEAQRERTANDLLDAGVGASRRGDELKAVASFRAAVMIDSTCWKAHYNLGWLYLTIGNRLHRPFMRKAASAGGDSPPSKSPPSTLDEGLAFYENALRNLKRVLQLNIQLAKGWCLLGQTQYYLGKNDEARASLRKAIELDPDGEAGKAAGQSLATLERNLEEHES